ncbi:MAG: hypothetical protein ACRDKX_07425, partial [Solirubrobacterales bacterium]
ISAALGEPGEGAEGFARSHAEALEARRVGMLTRGPGSITLYADVELLSLLAADPERARRFKGIHHRMAMLAFALWPANYWRFDPLDERDFEWFEEKYPGWYDTYGTFWEQFRNSTDPGADWVPMELVGMAPPFCWTCQMPCVLEDERTHRTVDERTRFYCSKECEWLDESNPGRYAGDRNYFDRYHGWELSEIVTDLGFLRSDGETMIAQPHLGDEGRWTLEHLRARGIEIASPNIRVAEELGLPSGNWANGAAAGNGVAASLEVAR